MSKKTYKAWCIWCPDIGPLYTTIRRTRADSIWAMVGTPYRSASRCEWRLMRRDGYRCVRVVITVEKGGNRG